MWRTVTRRATRLMSHARLRARTHESQSYSSGGSVTTSPGVSQTTKQEASKVTDTASAQAHEVATTAKDAAADVVGTAREQASEVVGAAASQAHDLLGQAKSAVGSESEELVQRLAH